MRIAFIGLGAIGLPMARRLGLRPEIELSLYDVRPEALAAEASLGRIAASVADAIASADAVFTVLPADEHVDSISREIATAGAHGLVWVDFSTVAPSTIEAAAARVAVSGVVTVAGALTRSVAAAEVGELGIYLGGAMEHVRGIRAAIDQLATDVRVLETPGAAKAMKIVNNMVVSGLDLVICEALLVAARHAIEPAHLVEALIDRGSDSWPLRNHIAKHLLVDDLAPGRFSTRYMGKDAALACRLARERSLPAFYAGMVSASFRGSEALGFGDHYHPIVLRWLEHAASVPPVTPVGRPLPALANACPDEALGVVCRGVEAQQALLTLEALTLLGPDAMSTTDALEHLESGSGSNDAVRALLAEPGQTAVDREFGDLALDLAGVCVLAAAAMVPAVTFEVGASVALARAAASMRETTPRAFARERLAH